MRIPSLLLTILLFLNLSCNIPDQKSKYDSQEIPYKPVSAKSNSLEIKAELSGDIKNQELSTELRLSNTGTEDIFINDVSLSTPDGLRSLPLTEITVPVLVHAGNPADLTLKFNPYNDISLYDMKDKKGSFKPGYDLTINYTEAGKDNLAKLVFHTSLSDNEYKTYQQQYKKGMMSFVFDRNTDFSQKQKDYLQNFSFIAKPPFIDISEQQIAVCGASFQLKCIQKNDSLHTELFIINHAHFPLTLNKDSLNIFYTTDLNPARPDKIIMEKISGPKQEENIIEKGDRVLIRFNKHLNYPDKGKLMLSLRHAFFLPNNKPLFYNDVSLKVSLP